MFFRILILSLFLYTVAFSSFQELKIGTIDKYYKNKINKQELRNIIDEIEYLFESTLNINVFDYTSTGKQINIIYVPPSTLEKRVEKKLKKLERKEKKIITLSKKLPLSQKKVNKIKKEFESKNNILSKKVNKFNNYVRKVNKKRTLTKKEYNKVQTYVKSENKKLNTQLKLLKKQERIVKNEIKKYNQTVQSFNNLIGQYNNQNNEINRMSRNIKKIKGMTFGIKEIKTKTYYKNGKRIKEKTEKNSMDKIEIYGFENLKELKAILAHEILHLVGIPHINKKEALMNRILQKNQLKRLSLTKDDIKNFNKHFFK